MGRFLKNYSCTHPRERGSKKRKEVRGRERVGGRREWVSTYCVPPKRRQPQVKCNDSNSSVGVVVAMC